MTEFLEISNALVWGSGSIPYPPILILLLGTGLYLMVRLGFMPIFKLPYALGELTRKREGGSDGDVSPFAALMTALSSTIGTGNIGGVAAAIAIGGPGAVFWMWITALVGMATKYAEGVLAVKFREVDEGGRHVGGPMYYIKNGMGPKWVWMGAVFAAFGMLASWGTGSSIQSNTISDALNANYNVAPWVSGLAIAGVAALVIIGGIKRIANVASKLVPSMAAAYLVASFIVIGANIEAVPAAFSLIVKTAFGFEAATGGFVGGLILLSMQKGVARGIFSNEAGQGSAPIAHAAAQNKDPVNQGVIAMLGTFIDTIIVCSLTALVILTAAIIPDSCQPFVRDSLVTLPQGCETAAPLTIAAFEQTLPGIGKHIVAIALTVFGFTTILGWSYYGERCAEFLFGERSIFTYKISYILATLGGSLVLMLEEGGRVGDVVSLSWLAVDTLTGLMAAPNLIALLVLSPLVARLTKEYFDKRRSGKTAAEPAE
ncbi:MAG: alanine/glycine:cation symporter family protein [Pseudomonadota bacterium]